MQGVDFLKRFQNPICDSFSGKKALQQTLWFPYHVHVIELLKQSLTSSCSSDENLHRISHNKATLTSLKHFHVVFELRISRLMGASSKSFPTFGNLSLNYLYDRSVVFAKLQDLSHVQWLWTSLILILLKKFYLYYSVKTWHERIISNSIRTSVRRNGYSFSKELCF